jgi:peptidoglycan L-alanyl-D-glutamate endopeptidase CwlK
MPKFSRKSLSKLETCDKRLQDLFLTVVKKFDCTILEGHRIKDRQKLKYPKGKHNSLPSKAVDVAPYPIDWNDRERFTYFAGYVIGIAYQMGLKIRWGGDWDMDTQVKDNNFDDLPHFEIKE